jgi:hypothetical protein
VLGHGGPAACRHFSPLQFHSVKRRSDNEREEIAEFLVPVFTAMGAMFFISNRRSYSQAGRRRLAVRPTGRPGT